MGQAVARDCGTSSWWEQAGGGNKRLREMVGQAVARDDGTSSCKRWWDSVEEVDGMKVPDKGSRHGSRQRFQTWFQTNAQKAEAD